MDIAPSALRSLWPQSQFLLNSTLVSLGVEHFFLRIEGADASDATRSALTSDEWASCVHASFADGLHVRDCGGQRAGPHVRLPVRIPPVCPPVHPAASVQVERNEKQLLTRSYFKLLDI